MCLSQRSAKSSANFRASLAILVLLVASSSRADDKHWSFQPIVYPTAPSVHQSDWPRNGIDAFILAKLESQRIVPSAAADRVTLIRRVTFDLIGLPPTLDETDAFIADARPDAYERLVDRLMASPHYGERWARPWLDLCHYGDTDGHLTDQLRPVAWRYRDWVTRMLNEDIPFDEFTVRQIAGDLLVAVDHGLDGAAQDHILGTGFLRQTLSNREGGADLEEFRVAQIVDRTSMVGTIWLGLTVGCARCHDHKYDPLTQEEFYRLYAFFDHADELNIDAPLLFEAAAYHATRPEYERRRSELIEPSRKELQDLQKQWEAKCLYAAAHPGENHVWDRQWELLGLIWGGHLGEGQLEGCEIVRRPWDQRTRRQKDDLLDYFLQHGSIVDAKRFSDLKAAELQKQLAALKQEFAAAFATRAPVMKAAFSARQTYVHDRGDFRSRGRDVAAAMPGWLNADASRSVGTELSRLELAQWLVSRSNPLTARVVVNRAWQEFFGRGLVPTPDDFGTRGEPPSHSQLLDWLASEFFGPHPLDGSSDARNWSLKRLHRMVVLSETYRQSSQPRPDIATLDPHNVLLARQNSLRFPAEFIRDAALAVSGLLSATIGGPSVYPPQDERVTMEAFGHNAWKTSAGSDRYRRGLYTFVMRTSPFAQAITFDAPTPVDVCTRRDRSNTPLQALTLLNDPTFGEMASGLAIRIVREAGPSAQDRIRHAFRLCLARQPTRAESERLQDYLAGFDDQPEAARWLGLATVLLNLHEFITRD